MRSAQLRLGDEPHVFIEHSSIHRRFLESTPQHRDGEALGQAVEHSANYPNARLVGFATGNVIFVRGGLRLRTSPTNLLTTAVAIRSPLLRPPNGQLQALVSGRWSHRKIGCGGTGHQNRKEFAFPPGPLGDPDKFCTVRSE